jgi:hypothetical protein
MCSYVILFDFKDFEDKLVVTLTCNLKYVVLCIHRIRHNLIIIYHNKIIAYLCIRKINSVYYYFYNAYLCLL